MRGVVLAPIAVAAVAVAATIAASSPAGERAPALPRHALIGPPASIASLHGRPALISFFASWCAPCRKEAAALEQAARAVGSRATVVGVDWSDSPRSALSFVAHFHWTFSVLADPTGGFGYAYGVRGLPTTFVLDRRGEIVGRLLGAQTLASLLREASAAGSPSRVTRPSTFTFMSSRKPRLGRSTTRPMGGPSPRVSSH